MPADEAAELTARLGALTRSLPVVSSDGTIALPEVPEPRLRVTVTWHTAVEAEVHWQWSYGDLPPVDLDAAPDPADALPRDRDLEEALLDRLDPRPTRSRATVTDTGALDLALVDLPSWRATEGVTVIEHDAPEFHESTEAPEFVFEAPVPAGRSDDGDAGARADHTDWLDLEVMIRVEGQSVPLAHVLEALTRGQTRLVLPSGLHLRLDRPEFERLAEVVRAAAEVHPIDGERLRVGRGDLGLWAQLDELGVVDAQAAEWVARARALRDLVDIPRPEPVGVASTLRSYQLDGFSWLAFLWQHRLGGILADDMGLGKTLQVLALIAHSRTDAGGASRRPWLVVAPTSVVGAWAEEAERHTPGLRVACVEGTRGRREEQIGRAHV